MYIYYQSSVFEMFIPDIGDDIENENSTHQKTHSIVWECILIKMQDKNVIQFRYQNLKAVERIY